MPVPLTAWFGEPITSSFLFTLPLSLAPPSPPSPLLVAVRLRVRVTESVRVCVAALLLFAAFFACVCDIPRVLSSLLARRRSRWRVPLEGSSELLARPPPP